MFRLTHRQIIHAALLAALSMYLMPTSHVVAATILTRAAGDDQTANFGKCWDFKATADLAVTVETDGANAYFVDTDRKLHAIDLSAGARLWSSELAGNVVSNLLAANDFVIVATQASEAGGSTGDKTVLRSVSSQTGITNWSVDLTPPSSGTVGFLSGNVVFVSSNGSVSAFKAENGARLWSKEVGARVATVPRFRGASVVFGTDRKEVVSIDVATGQIATVARTESLPTAVFMEESGRVVVGDDRGNLTFGSLDGKRLWRFRNGARISAVTSYDSEFLATSHDNFLYKLSRGGNVEWKRRLSGRIGSGPVILGDQALIATVGDGNVYVIDLSNGKIRNRITTGVESSVQIAGAKEGFVIVAASNVSFYRRDSCSPNKKTVPMSAPSS